MNVMIRFFRRLVRDLAGGPATEYALLVVLVAAVAGFGMIALGGSLSEFYADAGGTFVQETTFPVQPRCVEVGSNCRAGR